MSWLFVHSCSIHDGSCVSTDNNSQFSGNRVTHWHVSEARGSRLTFVTLLLQWAYHLMSMRFSPGYIRETHHLMILTQQLLKASRDKDVGEPISCRIFLKLIRWHWKAGKRVINNPAKTRDNTKGRSHQPAFYFDYQNNLSASLNFSTRALLIFKDQITLLLMPGRFFPADSQTMFIRRARYMTSFLVKTSWSDSLQQSNPHMSSHHRNQVSG